MVSKACLTCKEVKTLADFHKDSRNKIDGRRRSCRACRRKYQDKWDANNREKINKAKVKYRKENYERLKTDSWTRARTKYMTKKRESDPQFRIAGVLRSRLYKLLRGKKEPMLNGLGCSMDKLINHLESGFYPNKSGVGMSWDNYGCGIGKWQIDHKIPLKEFNLQDPEDVKVACHYTNLQPLWHEDHSQKTNIENKERRNETFSNQT